MITSEAMRRALNPLWWFAVSVAASIAVTSGSPPLEATALSASLAIIGICAVAMALKVEGHRRILLLVLAGLSLGGLRGLDQAASHHERERLVHAEPPAVVRIQATALEGWSPSRWGRTTTVRVESAQRHEAPLELPRRCRLEVRSSPTRALPMPGETIRALVSVRGEADHILLVVASDRLLELSKPPHGLPSWRDALARSLFDSAGTDATRIRAAELAGALALGRKDLLPRHRREGWRRSGLGHALAVSGLHVGVISGVAWLAATACGLSPLVSRLFLLGAIPTYVLLAGASPSATRAGIMISVFLAARLIGRSVLALGAVLLTATLMILVSPALVFQPGFQLTVLVTAALIRWSPQISQALRGPGWLTAAIAIPVVAQIAAAPIVGMHFRTITPLAAVVNLAVPLLLTPSIPCAVAAVVLSSLWAPAAAPVLDLLAAVSDILWRIGALGRSWTVLAPAVPSGVAILFGVFGAFALRLDRLGKVGAGLWIALTALLPVAALAQRPQPNAVELLAVGDGLAAVVSTETTTHLFDGGRYRSEAAELLTDAGVRSIDIVFASHGDTDHIGGLTQVMQSTRVSTLALPSWLLQEEGIVPLLRAARRHGTSISPVVAGSRLHIRETFLDVLWPPYGADPSWRHNDRSLVVRVAWPAGRVLLTGDIGGAVEARMAAGTHLACDVLVIPHHGSRTSSTPAFLSAAHPTVALIPAGPRNRHNHPHPDVVRRLTRRRITIRTPIIDGEAGAHLEPCGWTPWP